MPGSIFFQSRTGGTRYNRPVLSGVERFPDMGGRQAVRFHSTEGVGGGAASSRIRSLQSNCAVVTMEHSGDILFGAPPEIVKRFLPDFFAKKIAPPTVLVMAKDSLKDGRIQNEPEFPLYASNFLAGKKITIIGAPEQINSARTVIQESLFGPETDFENKAECASLKAKREDGSPRTFDDFVNFVALTPGEEHQLNGTKIAYAGKGIYMVSEDGSLIATIDTSTFTPPADKVAGFPMQNLTPPHFGVTFVGTSSGFDPVKRTTSFIVWAKGQGIFVDPLSEPHVEMARLGVDTTDVPYVLLTHCHADHDAGVLKRTLNGRRTKLITSRTVYESFLKKAKAYSGLDIRNLIDFIEAKPGTSININGVQFDISSSIHSIPTIRFIARYHDAGENKSLAYSSDTLYDPARLEELRNNGTITKERYDELVGFVKGCNTDLFVHEIGAKGLHTQEDVLAGLPKSIKDKMIVVHTGKVSEDSGLRLAQEGETISLVAPKQLDLSVLDAFTANPVFGSIPAKIAVAVARNSHVTNFNPGDSIVKQGRCGDSFHIIISGTAKVEVDGAPVATLSKGDYFGEAALLTDKPRNATVEALSQGSALVVDKANFMWMLEQLPSLRTELEKVLSARPFLSQIVFLRGLSAGNLAKICAKTEPVVFSGGSKLIEEGKTGDALYFINEGEIRVSVGDNGSEKKLLATLGPGSVVGEISLIKNVPCTATVEAVSDEVKALKISREDFERMVNETPSLFFHFSRIAEQRLESDRDSGISR